jgi:NAD(P)-dependent dehydrogenase (short-subunit alcohol dehydrogenase family)
VTIEGDIADPDTSQRIVDEAVERFGRIDILINNAGIYIGKPFNALASTRRGVSRPHSPFPG